MARVEHFDFDPSKLQFQGIKRYKEGNKPYIPAVYNGASLFLKTPVMPMPFGVGEYSGEKNIDLSFNNPTPEVAAFKQKMEAVDDLVFKTVVAHSETLFGKPKSAPLLQEMDAHNKIVREAAKKEYGFSMKTKWPRFSEPKFYKRRNDKPVQAEEGDCKNGCTGQVLMELRPIYYVSGKFGVKWTIDQVLVVTAAPDRTDCSFGEVDMTPEKGDEDEDQDVGDIIED